MSTTINLKALERKAWLSYFDDGLVDIYLGLLLAAMGASAFMEDGLRLTEAQTMPIYIVLLVLAMLAFWAGKRFITTPRIGRVKFSLRRKRKLSIVRFALVGSLVLGLLVVLYATMMKNQGDGVADLSFVPFLWLANCLIVFGLGAYFLDYNRLYLISLLYGLSLFVVEALRGFAGIYAATLGFGLSAAVILIMGGVVFVRFLRENPVLPMPPANEEES